MSTIDTLVKDLGTTANRIVKNNSLFMNLSDLDQIILTGRLRNYTPKTPAGIAAKQSALDIIANINGETDVVAVQTEASQPAIESSGVSTALARKIAEQTCVFEVAIRNPSYSKKVDSANFLDTFGNNGNIHADRVIISKRLIANKDVSKIQRVRYEFVKFLRGISLPGGLLTLGNGQYLVPVNLLPTLNEKLQGFLVRREELLNEFEENYPQIIENSRETLGAAFVASDYPAFQVIRDAHSVQYRYTSNTVPEEFAKVSAEIAEREQARIYAACQGSISLIESALRENFLDLSTHFANILGNDEETGKAKRFQHGSVDKLKEFVGLFSNLNMTGDTKLEELVNQAGQLLDGVDPGTIRTDDELRASLNKSFAKIKTAAESLVVNKTRKITLED